MQTFLPYPSFSDSARCLDLKRCGKQRIETRQICEAIISRSGWFRHPAVKQWVPYPKTLCLYGIAVCDEWTGRGYCDNQRHFFAKLLEELPGDIVFPDWFGQDWFHSKHRAKLLAKKPDWYSQFLWQEKPDINAWTFAVPKAT